MKIFEKIEYIDGGPNDKGRVVGYVKGVSREKLKYGINHGFIDFREISRDVFYNRMALAKKNLSMFDI